jgi:WD40 repeat protein
MDSERWQRIETLFDAALDQDPSRWDTFLDDHCRDDPALRAEVASLLASHVPPAEAARVAGKPDALARLVRWRGTIIIVALVLVIAALAFALRSEITHKNAAIQKSLAADEASREARANAYVNAIAAAEAFLLVRQNADARVRLEQAPAELRGWEWRHLWRRLDRSLYSVAAHRGAIQKIVFSRDGSFYVTASSDSTVGVWDTASGVMRHRIGPLGGAVADVAIHPSDTTLAAGLANGGVLLLSIASGREQGRFSGKGSAAVAFNPGGSRLAAAFTDGKIMEWRTDTRKPTGTIDAGGRLAHIAYAEDGQVMVIADDAGRVRLWNTRTNRRITDVSSHDKSIAGLVESWNMNSPPAMTAASGSATAAAVDPAGVRLVVGNADGSLRAWPRNAEDAPVFQPPDDTQPRPAVNDACVSPDGALLACASDRLEINLWNAETGEHLARMETGRADFPTRVAFSPSGSHLFAGDRGGNVLVFDPVARRRLLAFAAHSAAVLGLAVSPDGNVLVTAGADSTLKFWDAKNLAPRGEFRGLSGAVTKVVFAPDGTLAGACTDRVIRMWNVTTGDTLRVLRGHISAVTDISYSADGTRIVSLAANGNVRIWDAASGESLETMKFNGVSAVCLTPDRTRLIVAGADPVVRVIETGAQREVARLHGHSGRILSLETFPLRDGVVSASADGTIRVWDAK